MNTRVYLQKVLKGSFDGLNCTCRCLLTRRGKFCKEKVSVIERFDHYCPWIDNAVGVGNQRAFYMFVLGCDLLLGLSLRLVFGYLQQLISLQRAANALSYRHYAFFGLGSPFSSSSSSAASSGGAPSSSSTKASDVISEGDIGFGQETVELFATLGGFNLIKLLVIAVAGVNLFFFCFVSLLL